MPVINKLLYNIMKSQKELLDKMKREDFIRILDEYYAGIGRTNTPNYREYGLAELKKCIILFRIHLIEEDK